MKCAIHFVGFRTDAQYSAAVRAFGKPDFIHSTMTIGHMVTLILIMTLLYMVTRVILTLTHYIVTKTALDFRRL